MHSEQLESHIINRGKSIFQSIQDEKPSLFKKSTWVGKIMDWSMSNDTFKVNMFRFVDVFPYLTQSDSLRRHVEEYFSDSSSTPEVVTQAIKAMKIAGPLGGTVANKLIGFNIKTLADTFIIGENSSQALKTLKSLRSDGFAFVVDLLGESTISEEEAQDHESRYLKILDALGKEQHRWNTLGSTSSESLDWGHTPKVQISVKMTALTPKIKNEAFELSVDHLIERLRPVYRKVIEIGGTMCLDMESYKYKNLTYAVYKKLRSDPEFADYPYLGIVVQAYLRETENDLQDLLSWSVNNNLPIEVRLVKGAYWDFETILADQNNWPDRVWSHKPQTDSCFERCATMLLNHHQHCYFACGSHNIRSIAMVLETAKNLGVPEDRYEFQVLYGMAEPVRNALLKQVGRIRLYAPYGEMIPGMAYLVRRLLENTSNESFLKQSFADGKELDELLETPDIKNQPNLTKTTKRFYSEAPHDFTQASTRQQFQSALDHVTSQVGQEVRPFINSEYIEAASWEDSNNPNNINQIIAKVGYCNTTQAKDALQAAHEAQVSWRSVPVSERCNILRKAAQILRDNAYEYAAWHVLEVGKQWDQAGGDVDEAIDFLVYYADQMEQLAKPQKLGQEAGEINLLSYEPMGVALVVAPWNFPLAISVGMVSAALVTGNTVVYKPAESSSFIGHLVLDLFHKAGLPKNALQFVPGFGSEIGDTLVEDPRVSLVAFTGSKATGLRILEKAAVVQPRQRHVKKVVCEMGGKNALIIDDDADLDEAIPAILYSAFAFQGQKCSACSRLIVLDAIYDRVMTRLIDAAKTWAMGSPSNPANDIGALINQQAIDKFNQYINIAKEEGTLSYQDKITINNGYFAPITIVEGIKPHHRLAQEEVFGPILAVIKASNIDEAFDFAMDSEFALTGGLFSRSPTHLELAKQRLRVGNLYLNRPITGSLVGRQAFGGAAMSGAGTKAGGPDYLLNFVHSRVITENTVRRGFSPDL